MQAGTQAFDIDELAARVVSSVKSIEADDPGLPENRRYDLHTGLDDACG